ncbi:MAG: hypothetical protein ACF8R9_08355 [Phycisphaerales bacterium JB054]
MNVKAPESPIGFEILDGEVRYSDGARCQWSISLNSVRIIGECTNENGPYADDWFLCLVTDCGGWVEGSVYVPNFVAFMGELCVSMGSDFFVSLARSTTFASRVMWPESIADTELFEFLPRKRRLLRPFGSVEQRLSQSASAFLQGPG